VVGRRERDGDSPKQRETQRRRAVRLKVAIDFQSKTAKGGKERFGSVSQHLSTITNTHTNEEERLTL
jgi:hypothetical protein